MNIKDAWAGQTVRVTGTAYTGTIVRVDEPRRLVTVAVRGGGSRPFDSTQLELLFYPPVDVYGDSND